MNSWIQPDGLLEFSPPRDLSNPILVQYGQAGGIARHPTTTQMADWSCHVRMEHGTYCHRHVVLTMHLARTHNVGDIELHDIIKLEIVRVQ